MRATTVRLDFGPGRWHRAGLLLGLLCLLALAALTAVVSRRDRAAAAGEPLLPAGPVAGEQVVLPLVVGTVLGGPAGLLIAVAAVLLGARLPRLAGPLAGAAALAAGLAAVMSGAPVGGRGAAGLLALLAVLLVPLPARGHRRAEPVEQWPLHDRP